MAIELGCILDCEFVILNLSCHWLFAIMLFGFFFKLGHLSLGVFWLVARCFLYFHLFMFRVGLSVSMFFIGKPNCEVNGDFLVSCLFLYFNIFIGI